MKTASTDLNTHLQLETTSLATCWKVRRTDGEIFHFTSVDTPLSIDIGDGDGVQVYSASSSYNRTAIKNTDTMAVDSLDLTGVLDSAEIDETELRRGLFDYAQVYIFIVNHQDLTQGILRMRKGWLGEVTITPNGFFQAELRGLAQAYARTIGEKYTPECRADLGDLRCKIPINPDEVLRNTAYAIGDFVRASNSKFINLTVTNPGAESGTTGWTNEIGNLDAADVQVTANSGSAYFAGGNAELETKAYQDVSVPGAQESSVDAEDRQVRVAWYQQSVDEAADDTTEMTVRFYDGSMVQIGTETSAGLTASLSSWAQRQLVVDVPANTRTIRIAMHMVGNTGPNTDGFIDDITLDLVDKTPVAQNFDNRIYICTTAGTTGAVQPVYDTDVGDPTTDGSVVFTAQESWARAIAVTAVGTDLRKDFTVTELTPNSGGTVVGRDHFPNDAINGGVVVWETGANSGTAMEVRDFVADDGVTIEQDIELFLDLHFDIQVGDTGYVYRGCLKRLLEDCRDIFDNVVNFRGEPYVPGQDFLFSYPDAKG